MTSTDSPHFNIKLNLIIFNSEFDLADYHLSDVGLTQLDQLPTQSLFAAPLTTDVKPLGTTAAHRFTAPILSESNLLVFSRIGYPEPHHTK